MRQAGILAAAGLYALDNMLQKLDEDHANAKILAEGEHLLNDVTTLSILVGAPVQMRVT